MFRVMGRDGGGRVCVVRYRFRWFRVILYVCFGRKERGYLLGWLGCLNLDGVVSEGRGLS